jgi:NitT/TauT family transport system substrate-binding protein
MSMHQAVGRWARMGGRRRDVLLVVLALVCAACGTTGRGPDPSSAGAPTTISVAPAAVEVAGPGTPAPRPLATKASLTLSRGLLSGLSYSSVLLAQEMGEFTKENLEVRFVSENAVNSLLLIQQGRIDGSIVGLNAGVFNAIAAGADVRFVLPFGSAGPGDQSGFWVRRSLLAADGRFDPCVLARGVRPNGSTVVSLSDPTGLGSPVMIALARMIEKCPGQTFKSVHDRLTISTVIGSDLLVALQQGSVDLAFLLSPLPDTPGIGDYAALAYSIGQDDPGTDFAGWALGPVRDREPPVAEAFVRAVVRTVRTHLQGNYLANPEVLNALSRTLNVPADVLSKTRPVVFRPDQRFRTGPGLAQLQGYWADAGGLLSSDKPLDGSRVVDVGFVDRVARS